jgi:hypothetical protein
MLYIHFPIILETQNISVIFKLFCKIYQDIWDLSWKQILFNYINVSY